MEMTARDIQRRMIFERYQSSFVLHNYTPAKWWECDVFEVTKAGFFREYEIKLSLADFRADAVKQKINGDYLRGEDGRWKYERKPGDKKHDLLSQCSPLGPVQFWFVCPEGVIPYDPEFPEWAGLIYVRSIPDARPPWNVREREIKSAPRLHREKMNPKVQDHARGVCYWRLHRMLVHGDTETKDTQ